MTAPDKIYFRMEIRQNDAMVDQTLVCLSNDENVSEGFVFGEDMSKAFNSGKANIYTFIGTEQAAGNTLPMSGHTTVVPVGVKIATDGDYTFSVPDGTDGTGVTLVDTETGIRTALGALDYTVTLAAGTYDQRFVLEISPIQGSVTSLEEVQGDDVQSTKARKVMIDNILYIVKDGRMYDATGALVQ